MAIREVGVEHPTQSGYIEDVGGVKSTVLDTYEMQVQGAAVGDLVRRVFLSYATGAALSTGEEILGGELHLAVGGVTEDGAPLKAWDILVGGDVISNPLDETDWDFLGGELVTTIAPTPFTSFVIPLDVDLLQGNFTDIAIVDQSVVGELEQYTAALEIASTSVVLFVRPRGVVISNLNQG